MSLYRKHRDAFAGPLGARTRLQTAAPLWDWSTTSLRPGRSRGRRSARPARAWWRWARTAARAAARRARSIRTASRRPWLTVSTNVVYGVNDMASYSVSPRDPRTQPEGVVQGYAQTAQRWPAQPLARRRHGLSELTGPRDLAPRLGPQRNDLAGHGEKRAMGQV